MAKSKFDETVKIAKELGVLLDSFKYDLDRYEQHCRAEFRVQTSEEISHVNPDDVRSFFGTPSAKKKFVEEMEEARDLFEGVAHTLYTGMTDLINPDEGYCRVCNQVKLRQ